MNTGSRLYAVRNAFVYLTGLISGIYFISLGAIDVSLAHIPGDLGDARFNNYLLEHAWLFFTGRIDSYWSAPFMYPETDVITYSDNLLGAFPFYGIFRIFNFDRETSFQLWFILIAILNYTACYFFLKYLFKNPYAAVCGAMIFAFSIALNSQIGHAQTFPRFMIPLSLWMAVMFLKELRVKYFFLTLLCIAYQMYCGFYLGFMLCVPVAIFFATSIFFKKKLYKIKIRSRRWNFTMLFSTLGTILILLPIVIPYLHRARQTGFYGYAQVVESVPTIISFFYSHHGSLFWDFINNVGVSYPAFWDHQIFPGGTVIICSMVALIIVIRKMSGRRTGRDYQPVIVGTYVFKILLITALVTFLFFIRIGEYSLYRILHQIPGFGAMRALQRVINIELLFFGILVAYVFNVLLKINKKSTIFFFLAVVIFIIADNRIHPDTVNKYEKSVAAKRVQDLVLKIRESGKESVLSFEPDSISDKVIYYQLDAMLAAQLLNIATLNGYSATSPKGYNDYWINPNERSRKKWLQEKEINLHEIIIIR